MIVIAIKISVPLPITPNKYATTSNNPNITPPNAAAVGISSSFYIDASQLSTIIYIVTRLAQ